MKTGITKLICPYCCGGVVPVTPLDPANYRCQNPECSRVVHVTEIKFIDVATIG